MTKARGTLLLVVALALAAGAGVWWWGLRDRPSGRASVRRARRRAHRVDAQRPHLLQPLRAGRRRHRSGQPLTQARLVRVNRAHRRARAVAGRTLVHLRRRPDLHADAAPGGLLRRRPLHRRRRAVFVRGGLRPARAQSAAAVAAGRRSAAQGLGPRPGHGGHRLPGSRSRPACGCSTTCRSSPKHKLAAALAAGTFADEWTPGPAARHHRRARTVRPGGARVRPAPRLHRATRTTSGATASGAQLPYLDKLTVLVIADQTTEALRLQAGEIDLMANGEIRPQDYAELQAAGVRRPPAAASGRHQPGSRRAVVQPVAAGRPHHRPRPAGAEGVPPGHLAAAVDRQAVADAVYLGAAVPIFGPITPGNPKWYQRRHAAARLRSRQGARPAGRPRPRRPQRRRHAGDARRQPARFSMLSQTSHIRGRMASALQAQLQQIGIGVDLVALDPKGIVQRFGTRRLRQHLLRHPGEQHRSGAQPRLLAQFRRRPPVEPGTADARRRLGAADR